MTLGGPGPGDGVGRGDRPRPTRVVVVGGANVDIVARAGAGVVAGSSTPGLVVSGDGGVARNIAENLARLATPVLLVAPIGPDDAGAGLRARCAAIGIDTRALIAAPQPTGRYVAVLDRDGELLAGINDMRAVEALTPADVDAVAGDLTGSDVVVLDANLPTPVLATLARAAAAVGAPVVAEPVSVAKAPRILTALQPRPWLLTPTTAELAALCPEPVGGGDRDTDADRDADAERAGRLVAEGVGLVWQRRGAAGSVLFGARPGERLHTPAPRVPVVDVTGAGDALLAGFLHAWLAGAPLSAALRYGHTVAALTVSVPHTVRPDLSPALVERFRSSQGVLP